MTRYVLAADADKIQDFVFRSAYLREVVGGSQILSRFDDREEGAAAALGIAKEDLVVSGGGSLTAIFDDEDQAIQFGNRLAELYNRATDGTFTVIRQPVPFEEGGFAVASKEAQERLRRTKSQRWGAAAPVHFPYAAICAVCGRALAITHEPRHDQEEQGQYLCATCLTKKKVREQSDSLDHFLRPLMRAVLGEEANLREHRWPGGQLPQQDSEEIDPTADIARFDSRRYVAYLVADGNNMGKVYEQCDQEQMQILSKQMTKRLRDSLAAVTRALRQEQKQHQETLNKLVPVLPLILGGDDLFALLPAPWALDFARLFCLEFEQLMNALLAELELEAPEPITIAAAVVICKESYPFYLAHRIGTERMEEAKKLSKKLADFNSQHLSTVNFEVILGSRLEEVSAPKSFRATLTPYFVSAAVEAPPDWGISLQRLLDYRLHMSILPHKRLAQLRALFDPTRLPTADTQMRSWQQQRDVLLERIGREDPSRKQLVEEAFTELGGRDWRSLWREEASWYGHGLPDLLQAWDFAYQIGKPRHEYEEA